MRFRRGEKFNFKFPSMSKQGSKAKANLPAGGFVALGRDGASSSSDTSSRLRAHISSKRDNPQGGGGVLKKPRLDILSKGTAGTLSPSMKRFEVDETKWRALCAEVTVDPKQLLSQLNSAFEKQKTQRTARLVCAAVRECISYRRDSAVWLGEPLVVSSLITFAKLNPAFLMQHDEVIDALCSLLVASLPNHSPAPSLAPSLLFSVLKESSEWRWTLVGCFVDDSLHERCWVDRVCAGALVDNVISAFGTTAPSQQLYTACELVYPERFQHKQVVRDRYGSEINKQSKVDAVVSYIVELCERKSDAVPRNLLKTMSACAGSAQIRLLVTQKMDSWLLNGKLQRHAMELLLWVACNIRSVVSSEDIETLGALLKMRALKSKQINNLFNVALKEILSHESDFMGTVMKLLLSNELSLNRFPYNMTMFHSLYSFDNASASQVLAGELCQMMAAKEEYLRVSRNFLREFVRSLLRVDFDFALFAHFLFKTFTDKYLPTNAPGHLFKSLIELCWILPFLAVTPTIREATQTRCKSNYLLSQPQIDALSKFYSDVLKFFEECADFLVSHHAYCTDPRLFVYSFYRLLYLAPADYYSSVDNWPLEADVTQLMRAISDAPLSESLLLRILKAGADHAVPIDAADAIDLVEHLSKRASISTPLNGSLNGMLPIEDCSAIETLFATTVYRPPTNFQLNDDEVPLLAVRTLYWKAWIVAVMWVALNQYTLIKQAYSRYPTLKVVIHMLLTWDYRFPPLASAGNEAGAERMIEEDERELNDERDKIRRLEARLAGTDVDDADSKLLSKLCALNPTGVCRRPPDTIVPRFEKLNEDLDMSSSLSRCRDPDLLSDIIRSQGSARAMPSIMNLVESSGKAIKYLPVECVCELFLNYLHSPQPLGNRKLSIDKLNALRERLRDSLIGPLADEISAFETLEFVFNRLGAPSPVERSTAAHALSLFLQPDETCPILPVNADASPTALLSTIASFDDLKDRICELIAKLCPIETKSTRLTEYINFLIEHSSAGTNHLTAHHISGVVERLTDSAQDEEVYASSIRFFDNYIRSAIDTASDTGYPTENALPPEAKQIDVEFSITQKEKVSAKVISLSIGAILQLLCTQHGSLSTASRTALMDLFFPAHGQRPKTKNTEEIELLPSWLKLKMLCADDERIVNVALGDMNEEDALKMVQSFGLTTYSCTKLFAMLDKWNVQLESDTLNEARNAAVFIRAYKQRGAAGADKFLSRLATRLSQNKAIKMEMGECESVQIIHKAPPSFADLYGISNQTTLQPISSDQALQCIETSLAHSKFDDASLYKSMVEVVNNAECAQRCIALLKRKPSLLSNPANVVPLLIAIGTSRQHNAALKNDLRNLSQFVAKKVTIPDAVKKVLRRYDEDASSESTKTQHRSLSDLSAEQTIKLISDTSSKELDKSSLMRHYLSICPELVPCQWECDEMRTQKLISLLFGTRCSHLEYLISLMPTRCSPLTISCIIGFVLDSHNTSVSSGSVLTAVMNSVWLAEPNPLTDDRQVVLADYMIDQVDHDAAATLPAIVKFIDESAQGKEKLVYCIFSAFSDILSSSATPAHRRQVVTSVIKEFSVRYPEVRVCDGQVQLGWLRSLKNEDRVAHQLIVDLFSSADNYSHQSVQRYISLLQQLAQAQPLVIVRHLSLMGSLLLSVARLPMRILRYKYKTVLPFVLDLVMEVSPTAFERRSCIQAVLVPYFRMCDGLGRSRYWMGIVLKLQKVCVRYLELNASGARALFDSHTDVMSQMVNLYDSPSAAILVDVLNSSAIARSFGENP